MGLNKNLVTWDNMDVSKIEEIYNLISPTIQFEFTNKDTRETIKGLMKKELPEYEIKCDEENNPPEVIASGHIIVRVSTKPKLDGSFNYINVIY